VLERSSYFKRWNVAESNLLIAAFDRRDVVQALAALLKNSRSGRTARTLRVALRRPGLDHALEEFATSAKMANVRALAMETLLLGRAQWVTGHTHQWVDKSYGIEERVPVTAQRTIGVPLDLDGLITTGARDRAVVVRRAVVAGLIEHRQALTPAMLAAAHHLANDRNHSVRFRAEFVLKEAAKSA
jgi:hypothetical protein